MSRVLSPLIALALLAGACGGEPTITATDLARIMPSAAQAPPGTTIRAEASGPKTLEEFIDDQSVRDKLGSLGFKVAYVATFVTANFSPDPTKAPVGSALYNSFGVLLRDATAARDALNFYEGRVRARAQNFNPVLTSEFGKDAVAFRFSSLQDTPLPGIAYLWRAGNALFSVVGVGNPGPDPAATRALARRIDDLARGKKATARSFP